MDRILIELHYLPSIAYFSALSSAKEIIVEKHEHYQKQTFRNRCYVNASQGKKVLIVPVTEKRDKKKISEIRIDYSQKWVNNHWRTIQSAYGKAPFYEHYEAELREILYKEYQFLYELNMELLTLCLKWLKQKRLVTESLAYQKTPSDDIMDLRSEINPKKAELAQFYKPAEYYQVFGNKFVENLSLIDLIFCEGPGAWGIVQASTPK